MSERRNRNNSRTLTILMTSLSVGWFKLKERRASGGGVGALGKQCVGERGGRFGAARCWGSAPRPRRAVGNGKAE